jgi:hypothetical protein
LKTLVKLLIALVILNAAARGAVAAWTYYQFKDATQQLVLFGSRTPPGELRNRIVAKAAELNVPVEPEDVSVEREGVRTRAGAAYVQPVEFFPRYIYPINFSFTVEEFAVN